jgi:hypothetical protein
MKTSRLLAAAVCCGALALPELASSGCSIETHACSDVGCVDQATLELRSPTGAWTGGTYELTLDLAGGQASCDLVLPASPPATGAIDAKCTSLVSLTFAADMQCQAGPTMGSGPNAAVSETCTPVPGHFHQTLTVPGTPPHVGLTLARDGHSVLDTSVDLTYQVSQPNGPTCDPTCHQASAQLSIAADLGDGGPDSAANADAAGE